MAAERGRCSDVGVGGWSAVWCRPLEGAFGGTDNHSDLKAACFASGVQSTQTLYLGLVSGDLHCHMIVIRK